MQTKNKPGSALQCTMPMCACVCGNRTGIKQFPLRCCETQNEQNEPTKISVHRRKNTAIDKGKAGKRGENPRRIRIQIFI